MAEVDLQSLLNEAAGGDSAETEDTAEETVVEDETTTTEETTATAGEEANVTDQTTPTAVEQPQKKPNPMKEVRDKLNSEQKAKERIERTLQRFTDGDYKFNLKEFKTEDGKIDYDSLVKAMDEQDNKVKAESRGVSPEVQAEIDRIEAEKLELQKERLKVSMDRAISNLQIDMQLDKTAINKFFADSLAVEKNPYQWLAQGGTLGDLYYLIYRERLTKDAVDKAVADAKATWETNNSKKAPTSNPASSKSSNATEGLSMSQLIDLAVKK